MEAVRGTKEVATELLPFLRVYKDGTVERLVGSPIVPPSPEDPETGVSSKDVTISRDPPVSARLHLPRLAADPQREEKLPIYVYFHGGSFCLESAFSSLCHRYVNIVASETAALTVSVEYRLAPEHLLPAAYDDCWAALRWVASHSEHQAAAREPWLTERGDFRRVFIGGDSGGGNIAHNVAMRAGREGLPGGAKILGAVLSQPFFWGSEPVGSEPAENRDEAFESRCWKLVNPSAGMDDPRLNPMGPGAPSLAGLGCERMLLCAGGKDSARERSMAYREAVRESGWGGEVEWFEVDGEGHAFHLFRPDSENAKLMFKRFALFISSPPPAKI